MKLKNTVVQKGDMTSATTQDQFFIHCYIEKGTSVTYRSMVSQSIIS